MEWDDPRYETDPVRFAREQLGFEPDGQQEEVLSARAHLGILNCCRQWGKSTVTAALAVHRAATEQESLILVMSPTARQSREFLHKAARFVRALGVSGEGDGGPDSSVVLPNGSRIVGLPGTGWTTRGFSGASLFLVDEAARVDDDAIQAIIPSLATRDGDLWLMSTPNGKRGFFYEMWRHGGERWRRVEVPATECRRIGAAFLADERERKSDRMFRQEYLCEFVDTEGSLIAGDVVEEAFTERVAPLFVRGKAGARAEWAEWLKRTMASPRTFYVGLDLGKQRDHSALAVVERVEEVLGQSRVTYEWTTRRSYAVRHMELFRLGTTYMEVVRRVRELVTSDEMRGACELVVDATGVGNAVLELLRAQVTRACCVVPVTITSGDSEGSRGGSWHVPKSSLVNVLEVMLEGRQLEIAAAAPCAEELKKQLTDLRATVNRKGWTKYEAPGREHDDLVLALALACWRARVPGVGEVGKRLF